MKGRQSLFGDQSRRVAFELPSELESVALRLAHIDSSISRMIELNLQWSQSDPVALELHRSAGVDRIVVAKIRPAPPLMWLLFSDAVNQLRAILDKIAWHFTSEASGPLSVGSARLVSFPIYEDEQKFDNWIARIRKAGIASFGNSSAFGRRVRSLQPFADTSSVIPERQTPFADCLTGSNPSSAHALQLLQGYSNGDKHRSLTMTAAKAIYSRADKSLLEEGASFSLLSEGDVLLATPTAGPILLELNAGLHIERPGELEGTPAVISELRRIFDYVREVAVPVLVKGLVVPSALPPSIDLGDSPKSVRMRISEGSWSTADERFQASLPLKLEAALLRPPAIARTIEHGPKESCLPCGLPNNGPSAVIDSRERG